MGIDELREMNAVKPRFNLCKIRVNYVNQDFRLLAHIQPVCFRFLQHILKLLIFFLAQLSHGFSTVMCFIYICTSTCLLL